MSADPANPCGCPSSTLTPPPTTALGLHLIVATQMHWSLCVLSLLASNAQHWVWFRKGGHYVKATGRCPKVKGECSKAERQYFRAGLPHIGGGKPWLSTMTCVGLSC